MSIPSALVHITFGKDSYLWFVRDEECQNALGISVPDLVTVLDNNAYKVTGSDKNPYDAWKAFCSDRP